MKFLTRKVVILILVAAILLGSASLLYARDGSKTIEVIYRNIGIKVHGVNIPTTPENEPFIYKGRTYVPLRLVSEALGYDVDWNGSTFTVLIGETLGEAFLSELKHYHLENFGYFESDDIKYDAEANMLMDGQRYPIGIQIRDHIMGDPLFASKGPCQAFYNLDAKYSRLTGLVGLDDQFERRSAIVSFYGDNRLLTTVELKPEEPKPIPVDIDVTGVLVLKIEVSNISGSEDVFVDLANMALKK